MSSFVHRVVLGIIGYKLVLVDNYFILSRSTKTRKFVIWYIDAWHTIHKYQTCDTVAEARFNWFILMKRNEGKYVTN